jgi:hypothetical protein
MTTPQPIKPPFTLDTAIQKLRSAEDGWNSRGSDRVSPACSADSEWRDRGEFVKGRDAIRRSCGASGRGSWTTASRRI